MTRCASLATLATLALSLACAGPAAAQITRNFPATALRGVLIVTQPPAVLLDGQPARLAPGARIRDANNLGLVSGALLNQRLVVNYTYDTSGLVHDVWVLTPGERANQPWPHTPAQAATWSFNAGAQTWSRP